VFGLRSVSGKLKVLFSLGLALIVFPSLPGITKVPESIFQLMFAVLGQAAFGFLAGMAISFALAALKAAGSIIDIQIGFGISSIIDPASGVQATVVSRWYAFLAIMIFLGLDGHHWLVLGLINSFKLSPLDSMLFTTGFVDYLIRTFSNILLIAFNVAAPIMIAVILVDVTAGFIGRTAPRLNILIISFPFKIAIGFFVMMVAFPTMILVFSRWLGKLQLPLLRLFCF